MPSHLDGRVGAKRGFQRRPTSRGHASSDCGNDCGGGGAGFPGRSSHCRVAAADLQSLTPRRGQVTASTRTQPCHRPRGRTLRSRGMNAARRTAAGGMSLAGCSAAGLADHRAVGFEPCHSDQPSEVQQSINDSRQDGANDGARNRHPRIRPITVAFASDR